MCSIIGSILRLVSCWLFDAFLTTAVSIQFVAVHITLSARMFGMSLRRSIEGYLYAVGSLLFPASFRAFRSFRCFKAKSVVRNTLRCHTIEMTRVVQRTAVLAQLFENKICLASLLPTGLHQCEQGRAAAFSSGSTARLLRGRA